MSLSQVGVAKNLAVLACLVVVTLPAVAGEPAGVTQSADVQAIIAAEHAWPKAAVGQDAGRMASFMAEDYVALSWKPATEKAPGHWKATGKKEWVAEVRSGKERYISVEIRNITVHLQGRMATVSAEYSQVATKDGHDHSSSGIQVNTWEKLRGSWILLSSVFP